MRKPLLELRDLSVGFETEGGLIVPVRDVSFAIYPGQTVALVGESGCGKSVTALSILRLIPSPPGRVLGGKVLLDGRDLLGLSEREMRKVRGGEIAMIFQEPMTSLNPVLTIGRQVTEMLEIHLGMDKDAARQRAIELLRMVGISDPEGRIDDYPHQFSGGMRQRVMIAMALSCNPRLLIADEPTTALDVTTQAQLLELMKDMVERFRASLVLVTHNLGVVARYAKRIYIMYAGRIVEAGPTKKIFSSPKHPYTMGLLKCIPRLDERKGRKLVPIEGLPPNLIDMPPTCAFLPRCDQRIQRCFEEPWPPLMEAEDGRLVSCYKAV